MSDWAWAIIRWLHLVAMAFWLGGQLFLFLVVRPVLRQELQRTDQTRLTATLGRRFSRLAWPSLGVLVVTGWLTGEHRGVQWSTLPFSSSWYGHLLLAKMFLVALMLGLTLLHGRYLGPRLSALAASSDPLARQRYRALLQRSILVSTLNLLLTLLVVLLSARLVS